MSVSLRMDGVRFSYPSAEGDVLALDRFDLTVEAGEVVCVLGPSGCGKSTLLALAAGLLSPEQGAIVAGERPVEGPGVERALVFQKHALFPWETVRGNVEFGPRVGGVGEAERRKRADELLSAVGLSELDGQYPRQLSEGQRQRVGLARALANEPKVLLMDEPFASLDALTRRQMQALLVSVWQARRQSILFVTHDVDEALALGDRFVVLSARPAKILLERRVARPRDPEALYSPETRALREEALRALGA
ncbi:MAG: ABC transporter ATP-binding protein [Elusimicrobia bacterium]|nr:ABC transporter ATP-binding protein [Elusimicrobiota bacterium]